MNREENCTGANAENRISPDLSVKLRRMSFFCAALIVLLHASTLNTPHRGTSPFTFWIETILSREFCSVAVPMFFMISGFLLGRHSMTSIKDYPVILKKRAFSLLLPYVLWCSIYAVTQIPFTMAGNYFAHRPLTMNTVLTEPVLSPGNLFRIYGGDLSGFPADGPLWYVRNLFLLILCTPLLVPVMKKAKTGFCVLVFLALAFTLHDYIPAAYWQFFETGFSFRGLLFFCLGLWFAFHPMPFRPRLPGVLLLWGIWAVLILIGTAQLQAGAERHLGSLLVQKCIVFAGLPAIWAGSDYCPPLRRLAGHSIVRYSFFLFAVHYGILGILFCYKAEVLILPVLGGSLLALYFLRFGIVLALSLLAAKLCDRFFPSVYKLLAGGR